MVRLAADSGTFAMNSGYEAPATLVIRDSSAWAAAWATVHSGVEPQPELPAVDFSQDMLVLVAIGQQPNGGHSTVISLDGIIHSRSLVRSAGGAAQVTGKV